MEEGLLEGCRACPHVRAHQQGNHQHTLPTLKSGLPTTRFAPQSTLPAGGIDSRFQMRSRKVCQLRMGRRRRAQIWGCYCVLSCFYSVVRRRTFLAEHYSACEPAASSQCPDSLFPGACIQMKNENKHGKYRKYDSRFL